ncbi:MAG: hypothetical protein N3G21_08785 [Candidatus Hydrogenedentes bacterium]|nr:hypothetical protein [Candidatus Hydrogenedentota bacterium]
MKRLEEEKESGYQKSPCELLNTISEELEQTNGKLNNERLKHIEYCPTCKEYYDLWMTFRPIKEKGGEAFITEWEREIEVNKIMIRIREKKQSRKKLIWGGIISFITALFLCVLALLYFTYFNYDSTPVEAGEANKAQGTFQDDIKPFQPPPTNNKINKDM